MYSEIGVSNFCKGEEPVQLGETESKAGAALGSFKQCFSSVNAPAAKKVRTG